VGTDKVKSGNTVGTGSRRHADHRVNALGRVWSDHGSLCQTQSLIRFVFLVALYAANEWRIFGQVNLDLRSQIMRACDVASVHFGPTIRRTDIKLFVL